VAECPCIGVPLKKASKQHMCVCVVGSVFVQSGAAESGSARLPCCQRSVQCGQPVPVNMHTDGFVLVVCFWPHSFSLSGCLWGSGVLSE
jgi:hypothetical protein